MNTGPYIIESVNKKRLKELVNVIVKQYKGKDLGISTEVRTKHWEVQFPDKKTATAFDNSDWLDKYDDLAYGWKDKTTISFIAE